MKVTLGYTVRFKSVGAIWRHHSSIIKSVKSKREDREVKREERAFVYMHFGSLIVVDGP